MNDGDAPRVGCIGSPGPGRFAPRVVVAALWALLALAGPPPAAHGGEPPFAVTSVELLFQNGLPDITVPKSFPWLRVYARVGFQGAGLFDAFWVVDGRILSQVTEPVMFGDILLLATPRQPPLPTFEPGFHRVTLQVRTPSAHVRVPAITYFVTADEFVPPARGSQP